MCTRSSSNVPVVSPSNPSTSNPKRRNRRRSKQPFILEESPIDTMADQRTMVEFLRAPTEGYAEAIMVPPILAEQFKLKHSLINMMTSDQFFGLEKENPHDHIQIAKLTHAFNQQTSVVTTAMTAILKQFQATPPPASVKSVEEICVTCDGAHPYYQWSGSLPSNIVANPNGKLKAITTRSGLVLDGPTIPTPPLFINPESDPRVPLIVGRPFLWTARALINVHGEEMILCDGDERLTLNMRHDTSSYSNQPQRESINLINVFNNSKVKDDIFDPEGGNVLPEKSLDLDSTKDLHPPLHVNPLSGSTTYSSSPNPLLEELADELALITFPSKYDDDLQFDVDNLTNLADNFVDSMPEMFTDEHTLDYSPPPIFDEYDDDLFKVESDTENVYDDPFDSKGEKIKESKLMIDELDLPCDFLPPSEYDSIVSDDFSRVDAKPSTNNDDKVFNQGILSLENPFEIITRVVQNKKLTISNASLVLEDFDPPLYELSFFKEVPRTKVVTWDDLAFKLITLGWNVKHENFCKNVDPKLKFESSTFTLMNNCREGIGQGMKGQDCLIEGQDQ
nr:reverse transcriptase domain-containing protein [Tanacetum cinerariifolium]